MTEDDDMLEMFAKVVLIIVGGLIACGISAGFAIWLWSTL